MMNAARSLAGLGRSHAASNAARTWLVSRGLVFSSTTNIDTSDYSTLAGFINSPTEASDGRRFGSALASASAGKLRPFNSLDIEACRRVRTGKHIAPGSNPGVRIESSFLPEEEVEALVEELDSLRSSCGFRTAGHDLAVLSRSRSAEGLATGTGTAASDGQGGTADRQAGSFESSRVTGRPEGQETPAPWGYGDAFDPSAVPPRLSEVVRRIQQCGSFALGAPRDITVNYRGNSFFRLDPHLDPKGDGQHVFVLGLLSDVVLTFVPPEGQPPSGVPRRSNAVEIARSSWTDKDIDVLLQKRSLVHFTSDARTRWHHAIRGGLEIEGPDGLIVVDWWGKQDFFVKRSRDRVSIVVAFGEKADAVASEG